MKRQLQYFHKILKKHKKSARWEFYSFKGDKRDQVFHWRNELLSKFPLSVISPIQVDNFSRPYLNEACPTSRHVWKKKQKVKILRWNFTTEKPLGETRRWLNTCLNRLAKALAVRFVYRADASD